MHGPGETFSLWGWGSLLESMPWVLKKKGRKKEKRTNLFRDLLLLVSRKRSKLVKLGADEKRYCGLYNNKRGGEGNQ